MMNGALGGMAGNPIMSLFWILLLGAGIYVLVRSLSRRKGGNGGRDDKPNSEELLKQRYARGEISHEDYETMLKDLRR
jgi:putative membrane protein